MDAPAIKTYHCLCSTLLLSTTHNLASLPRRSSASDGGLDAAIILPLPPSPPTSELKQEGYTTLLSQPRDSAPIVIRREDGFEKRHLLKCKRCNLIYGYRIAGENAQSDGNMAVYTGSVIYLLPGGLIETSVMVKGEKPADESLDIRRVEQ
ncbi:hypothetical protein GLAREA_01713 [Glarea lozoyensis ATCC 20868]|uniref:STEEP1 domain-containing protein n=1 Tax=Glarea lozoyensis (strain ATCC 20868 / MF5171) TaxID=1116229 RepID=S3D1C1_GLAL2|nr:uncharacterized protein GLAREA_01713 [Glarea lozoyensis ATCC 20868]EPE25801.1 hypothetical protein GLAREA_01713 [Glarea lozoyensis ATCC 20868]